MQHPDRFKRIRIIGAASGIGAQDQACADGPVAFHRSRAWQELEHHPLIDWGKILYPPDIEAGSATARIAALCRNLADEVALSLRQHDFPVVIGGDHSVAVGTWSGVAGEQGAPLGLLWIDAHLDSHTPETSYSGAIHGMPLACLLGRGDKRLLNLGLSGPQVSAAHTVVIGTRSYEPEEFEFLQHMGVRIFDSDEIRLRGIQVCLDEAIRIVSEAPNGFGVTLDLDAIDPLLAPGVGSPEPDGLFASDIIAGLHRIGGLPGLKGLEIVEYNPDRDRRGITASLISQLIEQILP